jgi:hypothetical protein
VVVRMSIVFFVVMLLTHLSSGLMNMKAKHSSEMLVSTYKMIWGTNQKGPCHGSIEQ